MFYSVGQYSSAGARKGVSGLISGMDTDTMVEQMTSGTRNKITTQLQKKQLAQWKQDAYREIIKSATSFRTKYFSYTSGKTNIMSPNFFNTSVIKSSSDYVKVSGSNESAKNVKINDIISMAEYASFTTNKNFSSQSITTGEITENWDSSLVNGQSVNLSIDGKAYAISIPNDFRFEEGLDEAGKFRAIVAELNKSVEANDQIKGKVEFNYTADKTIQIYGMPDEEGHTPQLQIAGGGTGLLTALGLPTEIDSVGPPSTTITSGETIVGNLFTRKSLSEALSGSSLTFSFNGVSKTIKFNDTETGFYDTPQELAEYLQSAANKAFGYDKVKISQNNGKMSFKTTDKNDTFTLVNTDKAGVLGKNGALNIAAGTSNRITWNTSMKELVESGQFGDSAKMKADAKGNYMMKINGTVITVNEKDSLNKVLSTINNSGAGVNVTYSTTSDTFTMEAKDSGSNGSVTVNALSASDGLVTDGTTSNDIGEVFFGTNADMSFSKGRDAQLEVSFDGGRTSSIVTRSTNAFTLDGLSITLTGAGEKDPIDLAGQKLSIKYDGNDYDITLDADFVLDPKLSASQREAKILTALNEKLTEQGVNASFALTSDRKNYILKSSDGKTVSINSSANGSSDALLGAIGFTSAESSADGTYQIGISNCITMKQVEENISFTSEANTDDLVAKIQTFLDDYNAMIKLIDGKITEKKDKDYYPLTDEEKKDLSEDQVKKWDEVAKKGILANDQALNSFLTNIRQSMNAMPEIGKSALFKIGIKTTDWEENGQFHITDEAALRKALAEDPDAVTNLFTKVVAPEIPIDATPIEKKRLENIAVSKSGLAVQLDHLLNGTVGTFGGDGTLISIAGIDEDSSVGQDRISMQIKSIDKQLKALRSSLEAEETRYYKQFAAMEQYMNRMNSQSSWLQQSGSPQ